MLAVNRGRGFVAFVAMVFLAACNSGGDTSADWPLPGRDATGQYYSALDGITAENVGRLGLAFEFRDFVVRGRTHRGVEATPLMVDGVLYFSGPWGVAYAVDARTGKSLWTYDPDGSGYAARNSCCDAVNRGVAVADGRLFTVATDGQLAAVDLKSGKELWKVATITDDRWNTSSTDKPIIANDLVIIGNAGGDMGSRGYVSAYHVKTGELAWRFWVVPGDPADGPDESPDVTKARETWPDDTRWDLGLGGNSWAGLTYDASTDTVFVGTGNGGPHPAWLRSKSGDVTDQLYLSSIVALDRDNGRVKWHYQTTPGDSWDFNASSPMVMADIEVAGVLRKVVMQAPKNGFFYMLDRTNGELLTAEPYTAVNWASHVDKETGRPVLTEAADYSQTPQVIWPGIAGAHSWTPMAFSPRTGLVYLQVHESGASYQTDPAAVLRRGAISQSTSNAFPPFADPRLQAQYDAGPHKGINGALKAIDPVTGKVRWQDNKLPFLTTGTLVSGDLVFQGSTDGYFNAYDAATGKRVLHLFVGTGIMGSPITYELDGVQYIAFLAGFGGPQGANFPPDLPGHTYQNFERLIVLKLDGAAIPMPPKVEPAEQQPVPARIAASAGQIARGAQLFDQYCHRCHWTGGAASNYPNLWNMAPNTIESFDAIVGQGAFEYAGMAGFADALSPSDIQAIKAFIVNDTVTKRRQGRDAGAHSNKASH